MSVNNDHMAEVGATNAPVAASPHEIHSRTLLVSITQSPAGLDSLGAPASSWSLEPKTAAAIFGTDETQSHDVTMDQLKNAIVHKIVLESCHTNFPDTHALYIDGYTASEYNQNGEPAHIHLLGSGNESCFFVSFGGVVVMTCMRVFRPYNHPTANLCE
jgi:hypothetical protein